MERQYNITKNYNITDNIKIKYITVLSLNIYKILNCQFITKLNKRKIKHIFRNYLSKIK